MANFTSFNIAKDLGKLFYVSLPSETSFKTVEECPDYLQQTLPYMIVLIVLEATVNWVARGKRVNVADSMTNISCGLLMTLGNGLTEQVQKYII